MSKTYSFLTESTSRSRLRVTGSQALLFILRWAVEAVRSGLGIGVLHQFLLGNGEGLVSVLPELRLSRELFLVSHPNTERIPRIQAVLNFMRTLRGSVR